MAAQKYRRHVRIPGFDYSADGNYFVTICTSMRKKSLRGCLADMAENELIFPQKRFPGLKVDTRVVMDDHVHVIFSLQDCSDCLSDIVKAYKSITTLKAKRMGYRGVRFWQPNYYEHVIRNDDGYCKIVKYIMDNPAERDIKVEKIYNFKTKPAQKKQAKNM